MTEVISGPLWAARNWSADEGAGSIHDDATAERLGFRGGTVAGDIHMNQFPPVLLQIFGNEWFERGNLSLNFKNATVDKEQVQVFAEQRTPGNDSIKVWMEREDGMLVPLALHLLGNTSIQNYVIEISAHVIRPSCVFCTIFTKDCRWENTMCIPHQLDSSSVSIRT